MFTYIYTVRPGDEQSSSAVVAGRAFIRATPAHYSRRPPEGGCSLNNTLVWYADACFAIPVTATMCII